MQYITITLGFLIIKGSLTGYASSYNILAGTDKTTKNGRGLDRASFLNNFVTSSVVLLSSPLQSFATTVPSSKKMINISDDELSRIIRSDIVDRAFLATADLTREVYDENASFTDEIDTYSLEKWITGTKKLFNGDKSRVRLVGDVEVTPLEARFRFDEDLMFRIPLNPVVTLSGLVILKRDSTTGLITSYREYWDQDVATVLKSAKFLN